MSCATDQTDKKNCFVPISSKCECVNYNYYFYHQHHYYYYYYYILLPSVLGSMGYWLVFRRIAVRFG